MSRPQRPPRIGAIDGPNLDAVSEYARAMFGDVGRPATLLLDELAYYGASHGFGQIWIHRSALAGLGLPQALTGTTPRDLARVGREHPFTAPGRFRFHPAGLSYWIKARDGDGHRVDFGIPAYDGSSPFNACRDARELRAAATLFASHLGIPFADTPGSTGAALLRAVHSGPGARRLEPSGDPPEPATRPVTERDFSWWRPPDLDERTAAELHAYDVNGNYLAACSSIELGLGAWEELGDGRTSIAVNPRIPGYWLCRLLPPGDPRLPDPLDPAGRARDRDRWLATPTAELAVELGRVQSVLHAVIWPERSRVLAPWYERIRDARTSLAAAAVTIGERGELRADSETRPALVALRAVKDAANLTIGQLAAHFRSVGDELYRPDWRHAVIARARANLYRHLAAAAHRTGRRPVAVDHDTVWFAGPADPPVPLDSRLGRFKYVGSVSMADALAGPWDARSGLLSHLRGLLGAEP